jgi:hypothetical protein
MPRGIPNDPRADRSDTRQEEGRKERIPLGSRQLKLSGRIPSGYVGRWVNDTGDRIQQALSGGYVFVDGTGNKTEDPGTRVQKSTGITDTGQGMRSYLMMIREDLYREDQKAKSKPADEFEKAIKRMVQDGDMKGMLSNTDSQGESGNFYAKNPQVTVGPRG